MKDICGRIIKRVAFLLLIAPLTLNGQVLRDTTSLRLVKEGIGHIYNLQFNDAREVWRKLNLTYPGHPVTYVLRGMITYWENYPLIPSSPERASLENDLRNCITICEGKHNPADEAEFLLANLSARGLLLLFYSENNMNKEVVPLAISTYKYIRRSFEYTSVYSDFYFFTGLYNYYTEAYPEAYPAYKPVAFLFPRGDRLKGLNDLKRAAVNSILFKAEASSFLSVICLSFENNYEQAYAFSRYLHELYPSNLEYLSMFIRNLLLIKQYDEAEKHLILPETEGGNSFFRAQLTIYNGILQEKKYNNRKIAEQLYLKGITGMAPYGYFGNSYAAFGYFGLSRISKLNNDLNLSKSYLNKANELADFKEVNFN